MPATTSPLRWPLNALVTRALPGCLAALLSARGFVVFAALAGCRLLVARLRALRVAVDSIIAPTVAAAQITRGPTPLITIGVARLIGAIVATWAAGVIAVAVAARATRGRGPIVAALPTEAFP